MCVCNEQKKNSNNNYSDKQVECPVLVVQMARMCSFFYWNRHECFVSITNVWMKDGKCGFLSIWKFVQSKYCSKLNKLLKRMDVVKSFKGLHLNDFQINEIRKCMNKIQSSKNIWILIVITFSNIFRKPHSFALFIITFYVWFMFLF